MRSEVIEELNNAFVLLHAPLVVAGDRDLLSLPVGALDLVDHEVLAPGVKMLVWHWIGFEVLARDYLKRYCGRYLELLDHGMGCRV